MPDKPSISVVNVSTGAEHTILTADIESVKDQYLNKSRIKDPLLGCCITLEDKSTVIVDCSKKEVIQMVKDAGGRIVDRKSK